jgi:hypothetical protein
MSGRRTCVTDPAWEVSDTPAGPEPALLVRIEQRGFVDVEKVPSEKGRRARCIPGTLS